jgi:hypothetical protein
VILGVALALAPVACSSSSSSPDDASSGTDMTPSG